MVDNFDEDTVEIFTPQKSEEVVAEFAGMSNLSSFRGARSKLHRLLDTMDALTSVPPHMSQYTLDQIRQAVEMVRYFKLHISGGGMYGQSAWDDDSDDYQYGSDNDDGSP